MFAIVANWVYSQNMTFRDHFFGIGFIFIVFIEGPVVLLPLRMTLCCYVRIRISFPVVAPCKYECNSMYRRITLIVLQLKVSGRARHMFMLGYGSFITIFI